MAITLTGTGSYYKRLGKILKYAFIADTFLDDSYRVTLGEASAALEEGTALRPIAAALQNAKATYEASVLSFSQVITQAATDLTLEMVKADAPQKALNITDALLEIRRQMIAQSKSIDEATVACSAGSLTGNSVGGVCVTSVLRGDGLTQEIAVPEVVNLVCISDSQTGGRTVSQEQFRYVGEAASTNPFDPDAFAGSGANKTLIATDASINGNSQNNILYNSDMEDWGGVPASSANVPDRWAVVTGTPGTDFRKTTDSGEYFDGAAALEFIAGTSVKSAITQTFGDSVNGTPVQLKPATQYAVNMWLLDITNNISGGVLTVDLVDGAGTSVVDDQSTTNASTKTLTALGAAYENFSCTIRTPSELPRTAGVVTLKLKIWLSTVLATGNLAVDRVAMAEMTPLYPGGPSVAVFATSPTFSGQAPFVKDDYFTLTTTNDYGGATETHGFHAGMEKLFGLNAKGILFPTTTSPDAADTLITS